MTRDLLQLGWEIAAVDVAISSTEELMWWLSNQATDGDFILAHAIDGVIWGKVSGGDLVTSYHLDAYVSPPLRLETLHQLRMFNHERELYLWRDAERWKARLAVEAVTESGKAVLQEYHVLWGTKGVLREHGFTLLEDGSQGLRHILPIDASTVNERNVRACMRVHHFLHEDPVSGVPYVAYSRLAGIEVVKYA